MANHGTKSKAGAGCPVDGGGLSDALPAARVVCREWMTIDFAWPCLNELNIGHDLLVEAHQVSLNVEFAKFSAWLPTVSRPPALH